ncbi:hypothetical protein DITRI_Ditri17bG0091800 [Diplodiscus trichospermus]
MHSSVPNASSGQPHDWSVGFCDCFSDIKTSCGTSGALYTLIVLLTGRGCWLSCFYRTKMRKQYMLKGGGCGDCMLHTFCETCALTQEYRELENRGFDMSIGWHANVQRNKGLAMAPVVEKGMSR